MTEATLLTLQHIAEGFQWTLVGTSDDPTTTAVVEQRINRFLQHPLFVTNDDVRCAQLNKTLKTVVAINHAAIQVVQVGSRKTTAIKWDQWTQLWRDHRDHCQNHPFRTVAGFNKAFDDLQTLDDLLWLQFASGFFQVSTQLLCFAIKVDLGQHFTNSFSANVGLERVHTVNVLGFVKFFFCHQVTVSQVSQARFDHDVIFKVQNAFEVAQSHVQHQADAGWQ